MTYDRWNPPRETVATEKPIRVFMSGHHDEGPHFEFTRYQCPTHGVWIALGKHNEQSRPCTEVVEPMRFCCAPSRRLPDIPPEPPSVEPRGKTWGIRERGDRTGTVVHAYRCPVHGLFDVRVSRADVPDEILCAVHDEHETMWGACGRTSPWAGSFCGQGKAAGEVTC